MTFRVTVRFFHQHRTILPLSIYNRRLFSTENVKSSVTVRGRDIKYVRAGKGDHAILCLPGALGSSLTDFRPQIERLDHNTFTVIAWDPPGYGHSRPPNKEFSKGFLRRDADYAVDLMRAINLPKFSILGWSDGGNTGILLAAKYPQNVRKMAVWGSNAYFSDGECEIYKKIRDVNTWSEQMRAPMVELYGEENFRTMWEQYIDERLRVHREEEGDVCRNDLKLLECPLFVLHGTHDPVVAAEQPRYIVERVPGSQLHIFENGKHNIHLRYADEFNALVHKFLTT